jgi:hypothetical protein
MRKARVVVVGFIAAVAGVSTGGAAAGTVAAGPPENPHGVGVCVSQVAIEPGLVDAARLGDVVRSVAGPGTAGSDVPVFVDDLRGDGPGGCGAPPGPGHLG